MKHFICKKNQFNTLIKGDQAVNERCKGERLSSTGAATNVKKKLRLADAAVAESTSLSTCASYKSIALNNYYLFEL